MAEDAAHDGPLRALDSFVGREAESKRLRALLRSARLLTLVGPGGVGKTRLALELVRAQPGRIATATVVELDSLTQEDLLPHAVATALGVGDRGGKQVLDVLANAVGTTSRLLVLDNCEHLAAGCARLAESLLRRCPSLRILATSREMLRAPGETVFRVNELPTAAAGRAEVSRSDAVRLFVERARACDPSFELTPDNTDVVAEICRRVDGLPLAIELAARRVGALPLTHILAGLDDQLALLTEGDRAGPRRHRELGAAIEWSYRLLDERERAVFRRLSVLRGGFDVAGARAVCGEEIEQAAMLGLLGTLTSKSLITRASGDDDAARFRQLNPVRAYGIERLTEAGERHATGERAAGWLADRARPLAGTFFFGDPSSEGLHEEQDNLAATIECVAASAPDQYVLLAVTLARIWQQQEHVTPGRLLLARVLDAVPESEYRGDAVALAARLACMQAEHTEGLVLAEEAVRLERRRGNPADLANALSAWAFALLCGNELTQSVAAFRECLDVQRPLGRPLTTALCQHHLAWALSHAGELVEAERLLGECLPVLRERAALQDQAAALHTAGALHLVKADFDAAEEVFAEVLGKVPADSYHCSYPIEGLAIVAAERGHAQRALRLCTAASVIRQRLDVEAETQWRRRVEQVLDEVSSSLSQHEVEAGTAAGQRLRGDDLVAYAVAGSDADLDDLGTGDDGFSLTAREFQVAKLVAAGLTNRRIADRLHLSVGTVATHLNSVRDKLGVRSRTQIAVMVARALER